MTQQNHIEFLKDQMQRGLMTTAQANVELVRMERVRLTTERIPAAVRKALNQAVKNGAKL